MGLKEDVVDTVITKLSAINGSGSYTNTVQVVERAARAPEEVPSGDRPHVGVVPLSFDVTPEFSQKLTTARIALRCFVDGADAATLAANLASLADDIETAIHTDTTLGLSGVISSSIISRKTDEADPSAAQEQTGYQELELRVRYLEDYP